MKKAIVFLLLLNSIEFPLAAQNVGIGTNNPTARLHVADSAVLFSGAISMPSETTIINPPMAGPGTRMFWFPSLGAFRSGYVDGQHWNRDSIGQLSFAAGFNARAKGLVSSAFGQNTNAIGNYSTSFGSQTTAIGFASTGTGFQTTANGSFSLSTGQNTTASGTASVSMGSFTNASGVGSISSGNYTNASGFYSFAAGDQTHAKARGSFVVGHWNDIADAPNENLSTNTDRIFQVGNGTNNVRSNALTILKNGRIGIGTVVPTAALHVNENAVLFSGSSTIPLSSTVIEPPVNGGGTRMMWYPALGVFRAGYVSGDQWDKPKLGLLSFASGRDNEASGEYSVSMGRQNRSVGYTSISLGQQNVSQGSSAVCIGSGNAAGAAGIAVGTGNLASGQESVALGSISTSDGKFSLAAGLGTFTKAHGGCSFGSYNDLSDAPDPLNPAAADRIFQLGNGTIFTGSNAITVLRNGNTGIGNTDPFFKLDVTGRMRLRATPGFSAGMWLNNDANTTSNAFMGMRTDTEFGFYGQTGTQGWRFYVNTTTGNGWLQGSLTQNSDERLKKNIVPFTNALQAIGRLHGYTYNWKDPALDETAQIGLLAQEVQQVFPTLVKQNNEGTLGVNYSGMVPVLLQAIKEQQAEINELKMLVKQLLNK